MTSFTKIPGFEDYNAHARIERVEGKPRTYVLRFNESQLLDDPKIESIDSMLKAFVHSRQTVGEVPSIVVDLSKVEYLSKEAVCMLIVLHNLQGPGNPLVIAGTHQDVMEVFQIMKLNTKFKFTDSVEAAINPPDIAARRA